MWKIGPECARQQAKKVAASTTNCRVPSACRAVKPGARTVDLLQAVPVVGECPGMFEGIVQGPRRPLAGQRVGSAADVNINGVVNVDDLDTFVDALEDAVPLADVNTDGVVDTGDVVQFISDYVDSGGN